MLNDELTLFLDDMPYSQFIEALGIPCRLIANNGESFYRALRGNL
jgi:hypothetical protein